MKITEHFKESEFKVSAQFPELAEDIFFLENDVLKLFYICSCILEPARMFYNEEIPILSGKRSPWLNEAIHGAENSDHLFDDESCAVDWTMKDRKKLFKVYGWIWDTCGFSIGEMILYLNKSWNPRFIHVSLPSPKHHLELKFDYNKGKRFQTIEKLPHSVYMKIFGRR